MTGEIYACNKAVYGKYHISFDNNYWVNNRIRYTVGNPNPDDDGYRIYSTNGFFMIPNGIDIADFRPALRLKDVPEDYKPGDLFKFKNMVWQYMGDNLAISESTFYSLTKSMMLDIIERGNAQ